MEYNEEFIIDFAKRTRANLEFIESAEAKGFSVYAVTQLCNSLLGLLVFPREHDIDMIPRTKLSKLISDGWPSVPTTCGSLKEDNLFGLVSYLRHGVAHCNIEFIGNEGQIEKIKIWNIDVSQKEKPRNWVAEYTISDLRTLAFKLTELLEESRGK